MTSGQTLLRQGPHPRPHSRGEDKLSKPKSRRSVRRGGADGLIGREAFSGGHHLSTNDSSHLPTGRSPLKSSQTGEHRPPRGGVMPERGQDSPRTRTPP
jgi:hypothetical protein